MKKTAKLILIFILIILTICSFIVILNRESNSDKVYAASGSSSDLQLMARAINGEARGEPYEGQVAVRSCYSKPCQKFKVSKHHSWCYL